MSRCYLHRTTVGSASLQSRPLQQIRRHSARLIGGIHGLRSFEASPGREPWDKGLPTTRSSDHHLVLTAVLTSVTAAAVLVVAIAVLLINVNSL